MIALSWVNFLVVILNIDNVLTYRQNRPRIMTPTNQQSGNTVPNQGNININTDINFMFPPVNTVSGTSPDNMEIPSNIAGNGAPPPSPVEKQITPTNPVFRDNDITSSNSPPVTSVTTEGALPPSSSESQSTLTNPVFSENDITSSTSPTVTSAISTTPTVTEVVINSPNNGSSINFTVEIPVNINIIITPNDNGYGLATSPPLELPTVGSTTTLATTVSKNGENNITTISEIPVTSPSTNENDISTMSENPLSTLSTIGSTGEIVTESLTSPISSPSTNENTISTISENPLSSLSTTDSTTEIITESLTSPVSSPSTNENTISTMTETPLSSLSTTESTIETITESLTSPNTNENTSSTMSENPLPSLGTTESTIETITESLTSPATTENVVTTVSENIITTLSTVGSTVDLVTENITSSTTQNTASTFSETVTSPDIRSANENDTENVISPSTTENTDPVSFPNTNENTVTSLSDNPTTTPSTNEKIIQSLTKNPINIDLPDPAPNGNNFIFTTQSSASVNTAQPVHATTVNIDLSDLGQNGINFGFTPSSSNGNQNIQNKMIYEKKCEEYYSRRSRKARTTKLQVFIVGGTNSLPNEFPHMAALGYKQEPKEWLCGGSLISENYVITAAHCLSSSALGEIQFVRLGTTTLQTETLESEDYNVIRRIPHPEYSAGMQYNDIALLQLDRPVTFSESIQPICLSSSTNAIAQQTLIATGWGKTEAAGDISPELQKVDLKYFPNTECQQIYAVVSQQDLPRGIDDKTQICAGSRNEPKDTCQGDSGGPLQIEENGRFYLIGITSFGLDCGRPGSPGVYTRVSYYIPWIEKIVWANGQ